MKKRNNLQIMGRLVGLVRPLSGYMTLSVLMGLIGHLCAAFITIFGAWGILDVLGYDIPFSKPVLYTCLILFGVVRGGLKYAEQGCNHFIAFKLLALIRDKVFQSLRRLAPAKLEGKDKGDLISLITSDIELLEVFYAHTISPICIATLFTIIMVAFIWHFYWLLGLIALIAYLIVGICVPFIISKQSGSDGIEHREKSGALATFMLDSLRGLSEILQFDAGAKRIEELGARTDDLSKSREHMKKVEGRNAGMTNTIVLIADFTMLFVAMYLYRSGVILFPSVLIPTIALMSSFGPVIALAALGSTLQNTFAAGDRVLDILDEEPAFEDVVLKKKTEYAGAAAENVTFAYGDGEPVLRDFSLEIPENTVIGITGKSGSGKSTFLKLLMRFWETQQGRVLISGKEISKVNTEDLRAMESYVTQETHLFHDSIANNVRIAKLDATQEEIEAACKKASVHDFIMTLPKGYDTPVGELGDTLSGGERQRLGLARAFLHDAPLLLLDEPTSNLDSLNEAVILKSLHEQREGKSVVLVSHRASTMKIADSVYSVENGRMS